MLFLWIASKLKSLDHVYSQLIVIFPVYWSGIIQCPNLEKNKYIDIEQLTKHKKTLKAFLKKYKTSLKIKLCNKYYTYKSLVNIVLNDDESA
jgi:hypothetical protein